MAIIQMFCPHCGKENYVSDNLDLCSCPNCGKTCQVSRAQATSDFAPSQQASGQPHQPDNQQPQTVSQQCQTDAQVQVVASNALLSNWKSAVGPAIGGAVTAVIIGYLESLGTAGLVIYLVYALAAILYALIVYPSFFQKEPKVASPSAVSFLNFMFGSIVFGAIWNHNLTLKKKGISNIVFAVICGIAILANIAVLFL